MASKKKITQSEVTGETVEETLAADVSKVTVDGIEVSVDAGVTDDYRFMRLMRESQKNPLAAVDVLDALLGDQMGAVEEHFEDPETGRVPIESMTGFLETLFKELKDLKN